MATYAPYRSVGSYRTTYDINTDHTTSKDNSCTSDEDNISLQCTCENCLNFPYENMDYDTLTNNRVSKCTLYDEEYSITNVSPELSEDLTARELRVLNHQPTNFWSLGTGILNAFLEPYFWLYNAIPSR